MSKQRYWLNAITELLEIRGTDISDKQSLIDEIEEILGKHEQEQEPVPVVWMFCDTLNGLVYFENSGKMEQGWIPLYTAAPKSEQFKPDWVNYKQGVEDGINQAKNAQPELLDALENWIKAVDDQSEWMKCRDDAKKAIAKAHEIWRHC